MLHRPPTDQRPDQRRAVMLSLTSENSAIACEVEAIATLVQNDAHHFHLLLPEAVVQDFCPILESTAPLGHTVRLLWLELSPYRVAMTMQGAGRFSYRHSWSRGLYGKSQYWLHTPQSPPTDRARHLTRQDTDDHPVLHLRNFTRTLLLEGQSPGSSLPKRLYIDYELWGGLQKLGRYALNLEIQ